jgi:hypothetical protein
MSKIKAFFPRSAGDDVERVRVGFTVAGLAGSSF